MLHTLVYHIDRDKNQVHDHENQMHRQERQDWVEVDYTYQVEYDFQVHIFDQLIIISTMTKTTREKD